MNSPSLDPLQDGISLVRLVDSMGNSLSIVNDARQSFDGHSEEWSDKDGKLLNYLAREKHTSPFRGVVFKWQIKAPLFIARQWWKHTIASTYVDDQLGWNEKSYRYCAAEDAQFYVPQVFMRQSPSNRQASDGPMDDEDRQWMAQHTYKRATESAYVTYKELLDLGVSKEQARGVLPSALYTSFVWTCSLQALFHFISLRVGHGAQGEIKAYAEALLKLGHPVAPEAFDAFSANNYQF